MHDLFVNIIKFKVCLLSFGMSVLRMEMRSSGREKNSPTSKTSPFWVLVFPSNLETKLNVKSNFTPAPPQVR